MKRRYGTICIALALVWLFLIGMKFVPPTPSISIPLILGLIIVGIIAFVIGKGTWKLW